MVCQSLVYSWYAKLTLKTRLHSLQLKTQHLVRNHCCQSTSNWVSQFLSGTSLAGLQLQVSFNQRLYVFKNLLCYVGNLWVNMAKKVIIKFMYRKTRSKTKMR